ncbi:MAG: hypothetical protein HWE34_11540 [Methylocystaceae bacterium]|nr:hypothetical protein [Methylocystaceae bacterium]
MNQLISTGRNGNPSGGTVQKTTIIFPPNVAGERLAAGVKIAQSGSGEKTNLLIMDPVEEPILKLEDVDMSTAFDPVYRAAAAKSLLLSGAQSAAVEVASPRALVELSDEIQTDDKVDFLAKRRNIAEAEQTRLKPETRQRSDGTKELFREMTTALSQPLHWASRTYSKAIVQYSCSWDLVEAALDMRTSEGPFSDNDKYWSKATSGMKFSTDLPERDEKGPISASAELSLGKTFTVRLTLE